MKPLEQKMSENVMQEIIKEMVNTNVKNLFIESSPILFCYAYEFCLLQVFIEIVIRRF